MDIHRCRFVPYQPQSINALAFSHVNHNPKQKTPPNLRLALGRENGDIEIWNPLGGVWLQEKILRGSYGRTVEQIAWTQEIMIDERNTERLVEDGVIRLFSSGGSSSITEWNIVTGTPIRHAEGNAGDIWCFAVQPQWNRHSPQKVVSKAADNLHQLIAAGCSDGAIILFSTSDDDLQFLRVLAPAQAKKPVKVISITWRDRNTVVAGFENGIIKVIDVPGRRILRTMSLGKNGNESCIVWAVKCLPDGTILSGDSSGELKIWDSKTQSLTQRLKTHEADILDIAADSNGDAVFTTGVDRRTVNYRLVAGPAGSKRDRWQQVVHRRYHQHDVKALATFESEDMSVMVSGGMDTIPIVMPLRNVGSEYHRSLSHLPQNPQMSCSASSRLMLTWWTRDLFIFCFSKRVIDMEVPNNMQGTGSNHKLVARLQLKDDENITSAQISDDGKLITAATSAGVRLFQLRKRVDVRSGEVEVRTRPISLPASLHAFGASHVGFSPDKKWLCAVRTSNVIVLAKLTTNSSTKEIYSIHGKVVKLGRKTRPSALERTTNSYLRSINCISFSSDSRIVAVGDLSGAVDVWVLEGHEDQNNDKFLTKTDLLDDSTNSPGSDSDSDSDSDDESDSSVIHGQKWIPSPGGPQLPQLDSAILSLSFKPSHLVVREEDSALGLHPTRHNPHPVSRELPSPDTKMVAITASHTITEFDVLSARLSDWSRRNPSTYLAAQFTQIKDRLMGSFWDCSPTASDADRAVERLWLYGSNWVFMLDMSRDLEAANALDNIGKIGKYDVKEPLSGTLGKSPSARIAEKPKTRKRKRNAGAGDQMRNGEWQRVAVSVAVQALAADEQVSTGLLSPVSDTNDDHASDQDIKMSSSDALTSLRRNDQGQKSLISDPNSNPDSDHDQNNDANLDINGAQPPPIKKPSYYCTFRYRAIFGISILSPSPNTSLSLPSEETTTEERRSTRALSTGLEIVIVERPIYDINLLPRFDGGQEWVS